MDTEHMARFLIAMRQYFPEILDKILPRVVFIEEDEERLVREYSDGSINTLTRFRVCRPLHRKADGFKT